MIVKHLLLHSKILCNDVTFGTEMLLWQGMWINTSIKKTTVKYWRSKRERCHTGRKVTEGMRGRFNKMVIDILYFVAYH